MSCGTSVLTQASSVKRGYSPMTAVILTAIPVIAAGKSIRQVFSSPRALVPAHWPEIQPWLSPLAVRTCGWDRRRRCPARPSGTGAGFRPVRRWPAAVIPAHGACRICGGPASSPLSTSRNEPSISWLKIAFEMRNDINLFLNVYADKFW